MPARRRAVERQAPRVDVITSTRNSRVQAAAALAQRKAREVAGRYLVEGQHPVAEALADGVVETLFVTEGQVDDWRERAAGAELVVVAEHVLDRLADSRSPQGIVGVARVRDASIDDVVGDGLLIVVHEVNDPGNAGTIVRTADAAGAAGIVFTDGSVDPYNPKAVRAAAGSLTHLPVVRGVELTEVVERCRQQGQRTVGLDGHADRDLEEGDVLTPPVALLFGSEAHGLPAGVGLDVRVAVPRYGRAESLNLAAAVAVAAFAAARRVHGGRADPPRGQGARVEGGLRPGQ